MVPSAMAHSVAHWASVRIIVRAEPSSTVPVVVGLKGESSVMRALPGLR
jgi:hypothetical protein